MLPGMVFSRTGCVLCVLLPVSAIKIRHWLNRRFLCVASYGLFQNWVCVVCMCICLCHLFELDIELPGSTAFLKPKMKPFGSMKGADNNTSKFI